MKKETTCKTITVRAMPGAEPWTLRPEDAKVLACLLSKNVKVTYWPRSQVEEAWKFYHHNQDLPVDRYAFRAWSRGNEAILFVDETETYESALWLLLHELGHLELVSSPLLLTAYRSFEKPTDYLTSDKAHESVPE